MDIALLFCVKNYPCKEKIRLVELLNLRVGCSLVPRETIKVGFEEYK